MVDAKKLISLIVENNPGDVKLRLKNYFRNNATSWTNQQAIDFITKLFNQGYNVSMFLTDVRILKTAPNFSELQTYFQENMPEPGSTTATTNGKFLGIDWAQVGNAALGIVGTLVGGSIVGSLLFPGQTNSNLPSPPQQPYSNTTMPQTFWEKTKQFYIDHALIAWGGTAIAVSLAIWGLVKLFGKKKAS